MPKNPALEDVFPKANLGIYQTFHLRNLNLMKDREYTRVNEGQRGCLYGHKETKIVSHKVDITAKRNEQCESSCGKHPFPLSTSAEKCISSSKGLHHFLKRTRSLKGNVENLESHLVSTADNHSNHSKCNIQLNIHSNMSEDQKFKNFWEIFKDSQCNQLESL